jgi:hypothetical protein
VDCLCSVAVERKNKLIAFEFTNGPPTAGETTVSLAATVESKNEPTGVEFTNGPPVVGQVTDSCLSLSCKRKLSHWDLSLLTFLQLQVRLVRLLTVVHLWKCCS